MSNFGALYRYECKKLFGRKIVWISFGICVAAVILSLVAPLLGDYCIDGKFVGTNSDMYRTDKGYAKALDGRVIDQGLMEETIGAYRKIPQALDGHHYTYTEEYQQFARPYSEIFNFIRQMTGVQTSELMWSWEPSEGDFHERRQAYLASLWADAGLSEGEMDYWRRREARIRTPYVYQEHSGIDYMFSSYQTVGLMVLLVTAICLSGMFSDEHTRKTDQIILCSPLGKTRLYWAKMAAGVSFAAGGALILLIFTFLATMCLYGTGGFHAAFQIIYALSSEPLTCGQALLIAYGCMMAAAVFISAFVMVLSELLRSNIATLAVSTGLLITAMIVNVPEQYRVLAQIWNWLPWCFLTPWNVFGEYTLPVFGGYLAAWQAVPLFYLAAGMIIVAVGKPVYQKFQVSGR